ncbi:MAG: MauE/DoxX family redox-associated membrane protein [Candidatus Nanopelagicales bacterium]
MSAFRNTIAPWIGLAFRLILAGVLGYAGLIKLFEDEGAKRAILAYRVFPPDWAGFLGYALPIVEVLLALLLLVGLFTRWAALVTALLMLGFVVGIASVWARGFSIDCGCFGGGGDVTADDVDTRYLTEIIRDSLFVLMAVFLVAWPRTRLGLEPPRKTHDSLGEGKDFESSEGFADEEQKPGS